MQRLTVASAFFTWGCTLVASGSLGAQVAPQVALPVTLELRPHVEVSAERIYFSDIGTCEGYGPLCEESHGIDLGESPAAGRSLTFSSNYLRKVFAEEWPDAAITLSGASLVKVSTRGIEVSTETVKENLQAALEQAIGHLSDVRAKVVRLSASQPLLVKSPDFSLQFPLLETHATASLDGVRNNVLGTRKWEVVYEPVGAERTSHKSFSVRATVRVSKRLPVAQRTLGRKDVIDEEDLAFQWVPIAPSSAYYLERIDQLVGRQLRHRARVGRPLKADQVQKPRVIRRGNSVRLLVQKGPLKIAADAKALEDGGVGDRISVQYRATKKKVMGRVVDGSTVVARL